jgi:hypothetical protein
LIKGKPAYMSPEQANGEQLDGRSDLFAVGVMMWEMLVGRRLFMGEDTRSTLAAVLFGQVPRPRSLRGDIPKDLERVVMKLLERDLPARYPTAEAAVADLLDCADAPRSGREILIKTLAERFPQNAPVRGSALRSRGGVPSNPGTPSNPYTPLPHDSSTMADGSANRAATPMPSLGTGRSAATATVGASPHARRSGGKTAVLIAAGLTSAIAAFVIVMVVTKKNHPTTAPQAGSAIAVSTSDAPANANVNPPTVIDAGMPDAVIVVQIQPDAGVADVAAPHVQKDASSTKPGHPATDKKPPGKLNVYAMPVVTVFVDGKKLGDSPLTGVSVPSGKHKVRLVGPNGPEELSITVEPEQTFEIKRGM